jgi:phosphomannomutase
LATSKVGLSPSLSALRCLNNSSSLPVLDEFDYCFAENGLTAYKLGQPLESQSFIKFLGEERYKALANFILHYIADMDIPIKR